jgi:TolB-like protein
MPLPPNTRLGPYEVIRLLGAGAMGEVYSARDTRLGRLVAVKLLPDALASDPARVGRFRQEALAAGALSHPNVVSVHDVGMAGDAFFVVSELIDGVTLRDRIQAGGLTSTMALDVVGQAASGLAAAHQKGILHRDLKPENIMITPDDRVKILDFGVAKMSPVAEDRDVLGSTPTAAAATQPGTLVGTVCYMSPEQLGGETLDGRSDVFSLGVILYEMLAGRRPFVGATPAQVIASILRDVPTLPPDVPRPAAEIVNRCLAKRPSERFASARELAAAAEQAVRRVRDGVVIGAPALAPAVETTVAVLPFTYAGAEPDQQYFSDGLTEQLIHELTRVRGLRVIAWHSASKLREPEGAIEIARGLGAHVVLLGSVRRLGGRVRIAARLVQTSSGYYLWSETYDRELVDLFSIQDEIARAMAQTLERSLSARVKTPPSPARLEAYDLYLRGRYVANRRSEDGLRQSVECFEQALAIDDRFAPAHAGLADACCLLADYGIKAPREVIPLARQSALRALELDPRSAEAHASYALIRSLCDWEWEEAEALYRRSIELNPGYSAARHWLSVDLLAVFKRFDEAQDEIEAARQLDPLSLIIQEGKPYLLMLERRYEDAIEAYRRVGELDPAFPKAYMGMGRACAQLGRFDDAIALFHQGRALAGPIPSILGALGQTYGVSGDRAGARRTLEELHALAATRYVPSNSFALVHAGLGECDDALAWLERGAEAHELPMANIAAHPAYDSLREDPRFAALLVRLRLGLTGPGRRS